MILSCSADAQDWFQHLKLYEWYMQALCNKNSFLYIWTTVIINISPRVSGDGLLDQMIFVVIVFQSG